MKEVARKYFDDVWSIEPLDRGTRDFTKGYRLGLVPESLRLKDLTHQHLRINLILAQDAVFLEKIAIIQEEKVVEPRPSNHPGQSSSSPPSDSRGESEIGPEISTESETSNSWPSLQSEISSDVHIFE